MMPQPATRRETEGPMRIFLSHSTKDGDFVKKLAIALEANGFTPWLCEVDIEKGANFVARINDGLKQSDLALLVWSPDAAESVWTEQEWTVLLAQQVEERKIRLAIIMLRDHPRPALLRTSNYIDARWDEAGGIRQTLEWLKGRQRVQRLSGLRAPVYLPDYRPQDFVGRGTYLARLQDSLTADPGVFLLYGEPGAGKSTLALRFAWDAQKDFDAVIFQTCGQRPLDAITAELVERLPIDVKTRPPEEQRATARAWLRERQSLLVLDDVWSPEMRQLEPGPPCSVLHTSRKHTLPGIAAKQSVEVEKFTEVEADELFHTYLDPVFGENAVVQSRAALLDFAKQVEWLPIAVAVGASMLREKSASALGKAVLKLRLEKLTDGAKDVNALFRTAIASQPEREQKLLAAGAVCVQEGFWLPLAADIAGLSEDEAEDAADRLVHSSLLRVVDRERRRFQLHALLREEVRARQEDEDGLVKLQGHHVATVEKLFKDWETRWQECRECLEEIIPAADFVWKRGETSRTDWLIYWGYALGQRIGELDAALRILKQEESLWATRDGRDAKNALQRSYGNQALILQAWGRLEEAMALLKKQEAICEELGNKDSLQISYGNQALILKAWGRLEEAMALHKKEEAICLELGNKNSLQASYGNQALILQDWGRLEEAMALLKKQEAICLELGNKNSLQASYGNQALILFQWGRLEEALALHKKEEAICEQLGDKDGLQGSYGNQANILHAGGRLEEALALHKKEEAICLELGNKNSLQISYGNQAIILRQEGGLDEALALLEQREAICLELGNKSHLGMCYWSWGLTARAQGDRKTEREKLEQALAIFTELNMPLQRDEVQKELDKIRG
jgi:tetratricopeptide (TPR) repeat protein